MKKSRGQIKTHLLLVLATFFWGITPLFVKLSLREFEVFPFTLFRLAAALITAFILVLASGTWKRIEKEDLKLFILVGIFGFFVFQFAFPFGVKYTSVSIAAIIMATLPVNVILINLLTGSEKITRRVAAGLILSVAGVIVITFGTAGGFSAEGTYFRGVLFLFASELGFAFYTAKSKPLAGRYSLYQSMFMVILLTTVPFIFIALKDLSSVHYSGISLTAWSGVFLTGIFGLCLGNIFWYKGIHNLGSTRTSVYANLPPVFGIFSGFIFLRESLTIMQAAGAVVIAAGVILANRKKTA